MRFSGILIVVLTVVCHVAQSSSCCAPILPANLFSLKTISFGSTFNTHKYCSSFPLDFPIPTTGLNLGASISDYGTYNFSGEVDFQVYARQQNRNNSISVVLLTDQTFANLKVSVLVSARPDIFIGTFLIDTSVTYDIESINPSQIVIMGNTFVTPWVAKEAFSFLGLYLSGLRACSMPVLCLNVSMDPQTGYMEGYARINSNAQVQYIEVTYVLSISKQLKFTYQTGVSTAGEINFPVATCLVNGAPKISTLTIVSDKHPCVGLLCPSSYVNLAQCASLNGTIVDGCTCVICERTMVISNGQCICPASLYLTKNLNCAKCWANSIITADGLDCMCTGNTFLTNVSTCGPPSQCFSAVPDPVTGTCVCSASDTYFKPGVGCACIASNYAYDQISQRCLCNSFSYLVDNICTPCWPNAVATPDSLDCVCKFGFVLVSPKVCNPLPTVNCGSQATWNGSACICTIVDAFFNSSIQTCSCILPLTFDAVYTSCKCPAGYYLLGVECKICWPNSFQSSTGYTCNCSTGFELIFGANQCKPLLICIPPAVYFPKISKCVCSTAQTYSTTKGCICDVNTLIVSPTTKLCVCNSTSYGQISQCKQCWPNSVSSVSHLTCVCIKGFISVGASSCTNVVPCSASAQWDSNSQSCQCTIPNMVASQTGCKCQQNYFFFNNSCICNLISFNTQGTCTPTPQNSKPVNGTSFICNKGYYLSGQQCLLVPICLAGARFSTVTGVCVCIKSTQIYDPATKCTCPANTRFDMISNKCVCNTNTYLSNGNCMPCWSNSQSRSCLTSCDCKPGFYNSGYQTCTPIPTCPGDSQFSPIQMKCVCGISGQVLLSGVCACPARTNLNLTTKSCVCSNNNYLTSSNVCQPCWANSVVADNGSWCVCIPNFYPATAMTCISVSPNACIPPAVSQSGVCLCGDTILTYVAQVGCVCVLPNAVFVPASGLCVCKNGFTQQGNACVPSSSCIPPATIVNSICACPSQIQVYSATLGCTCPQNMIPSGTNCICDPYSIFTAGGASCVTCPTGAVSNPTYQACLCNGVPIPITATCSRPTCIYPGVFDSIYGVCKCNSLYVYSPTFGCVCPGENQTPNPPALMCTCSQGYYFQNPNTKAVCKRCWANSYSSPDRLTCICPNGQYSTGSSCLPIPTCGQNQSWDPTQLYCRCLSPLMIYSISRCVCPTNMIFSGGNCICGPNLYMVGGTCQVCWENSSSNNGICICNPGYIPFGLTCVLRNCNSPAVFRPPNGCQCPNGYNYVNENCACVGANKAVIGGLCVCTSNTYNSNGVCISCGTASANQTGCYCVSPSVLVNSNPPSCALPTVCGNNQRLEAGVCVCVIANMIKYSNGCDCGPNLISSTVGGIPTCVCVAGAYKVSQDTCRQCWPNSVVSPAGDDCACLTGFIPSGSSCIPFSCIPPATFSKNTCVCPDSQQIYRAGVGCTCSDERKTINSLIGLCQCIRPTYYNSNGVCNNCWANSITSNNGDTCDCITGSVSGGFQTCTLRVCGKLSQFNSLTNKCECLYSFLVIDANNDCACPNAKVVDGVSASCVCPANTFISGQTCVACGLNSNSPQNSASCTCNSGFVLNSLGQCVSQTQDCIFPGIFNPASLNSLKCDCPNGTIYTLATGCGGCGANSVLVGGNCTCDNFSIPNPSGLGCIRCWPYSYRSGSNCICFANFAPTAPQTCSPKPNCIPGSVWSSTLNQCVCNSTALTYTYQGCVCPPTQVYDSLMKTCGCDYQSILSNLICQKCQANAIASSNSLTCICLMGYVLQNGQCVPENTCRCGATFNAQSNTCVCSDPTLTYNVYTGCTCTGANQIVNYLNLGQCVCDRTSYRSGTQCIQCMSNSAPSINGADCVCFPNYVLDAAGKNCNLMTACINGATLNAGNVCVCTASYLSYNPLVGCVCPLNLALNAAKTGCVCDSHSLVLASAPNGCTRCPVGMMADSAKTNCICEIGYYWKNGTCLLIPPCIPEAYFDQENQKCFCFKSASIVNDGCGCVKIFDSITVDNVCSCFLRANPITNYVLEGCSANALLINRPTATLTLKDIVVSNYSVVLSMCGIGRISSIMLQKSSNWTSTYIVKVSTSSALVSTGMTYSGCFTVVALIPSTVMSKLEILLTNSTVTTQIQSTPQDRAVVGGTIYAQNEASITIK